MKTRSESLKELEEAKRVIEKELDTKVEIKEFPYGALYLEVAIDGAEHGYINGNLHAFTPDPDTKEQALEKAQALQREKEIDPNVMWCDCYPERTVYNGENGNVYIVQWFMGDSISQPERKLFPFVDEVAG